MTQTNDDIVTKNSKGQMASCMDGLMKKEGNRSRFFCTPKTADSAVFRRFLNIISASSNQQCERVGIHGR